ncbi:Zinc finger, C2H2 type family protein [Brugia malayi]|uniref:Bm10659 n=1 Tax=Brugia malayi TaxID=6279 RepID=A8NK47_BRUMA|nr:Zinc finger, C2H2 type family protein [Brugia malayi]CDQ03960.1 Bm10659 [Brugia malayi]VIO90747.1 Zinc finger, C2H2 type family protein [Brugia malayi]
MIQIIWLSFLICIVLAENETISLLNLDIDDITWDDCSNGYFSTNFNILDSTNLESILGSSIDAHKSEPRNTGRELPGTSAGNLEDSISSDFSHFDFTDLWKSEHRSNEDSKIGTVLITTGNSQLQELPRTDGENMHSSISANIEKPDIKPDLVPAKNSKLFVPQNVSITDRKNYECPHIGCAMIMKNYNQYIAHRKTHPKPFIYECKVFGCGRTFNYPSSLSRHQEMHRPKVQCGDCGKIFSCKNNLKFHKKRCTKAPHEENYECPHVGCTMKTKNYKEYIAHRKTHPKPFVYECKVSGCGRTFTHPSSFSFHHETHKLNVHCENCGKIFIYRNNLSAHRKHCTKAPR